jgi:glycolate oxidase
MDELKKIVGDANFSADEKVIAANSSDMSHIPAKAQCVVYPATSGHVVEIIKYANANDLNIVPRGAGTDLVGGAVADNAVVLDMKRMDKVLNLDLQGKTVTVEPGLILDKLNTELEKKGMFFPVRPSSHMIATIGGMVATNAVGDRAVMYGRMLDNVDEIEVVTGNGDLVKVFGERMRIFSGTEGTMGIIVKAKLRLMELPKDFSMSLYEFDNPDQMMEKVKEVKDDIEVSAIEFMDNILHKLEGFDNEYLLIVEYLGPKGDIKDKEKMVEVWKERDKAYGVLSSNGYKSIEDPQIPLENIATFLDWLKAKGIPSFAHVGYGIIHPCVEPEKTHLIEEMYSVVRDLKGKVSGEHGIGLVKSSFLNDVEKSEHILLKDHYDKNRILNRNKVVSE